jgi:hypothetical protein
MFLVSPFITIVQNKDNHGEKIISPLSGNILELGKPILVLNRFSLHCDGGEGPYVTLLIRTDKDDICMHLNKHDCHALSEALRDGKFWCENGQGPGMC